MVKTPSNMIYNLPCPPLFIWLPWILILITQPLLGQSNSREEIVAAMTYKVAETMTWPDEQNFSTFKILLIGTHNKRLLKAFKNIASLRNLKGAKIEILKTNNVSQLPFAHLVFVDQSQNRLVERVSEEIAGSPSLLITDNQDNQRIVMINLIEQEEVLNFEYNKANIINQGLRPGPELILLKGTEIDVATLYKEGQETLGQLQKKLRSQEQQIKTQENRLAQLQSEISQSQFQLDSKKGIIEEQRLRLEEQNRLANEATMKLSRQQNEFTRIKKEIENSRDALIHSKTKNIEQRKKIEIQEEQLAEQLRTLEQQRAIQKTLQKESEEQKKDLIRREEKIREISKTIRANKAVLADQESKIRTQEATLNAHILQIRSQKNALRL